MTMESQLELEGIDSDLVVEACYGGLHTLYELIEKVLGKAAMEAARHRVTREGLDEDTAIDLLGDALLEGNLAPFQQGESLARPRNSVASLNEADFD